MKSRVLPNLIPVGLVVLGACGGANRATDTTTTAALQAGSFTRLEFNQLAMARNLPLYWSEDLDADATVDPAEIVLLDFYDSRPTWVANGEFTPAFHAAVAEMRAERERVPANARENAVRAELMSAAPTLLRTAAEGRTETERRFIAAMMGVGAKIDALYAKQIGMDVAREHVAADAPSQSAFRRNWGVDCESGRAGAECTAASDNYAQRTGVYPYAAQGEPGFCEAMEQKAGDFAAPFTVVREVAGELVALPFTHADAFGADMLQVAADLERAAALADQMSNEAPLAAYLRAAAGSFRSNNWVPADEAWAAMNVRNSAWYLRVAPDEVYWDPCALKAGFHMTFAKIDQGSLAWQDRLAPVQQELERELAALIPGSYAARDVAFHLPDFIEIIGNFGDDRDSFGATIGQSLPNWGPVAEQSRGRTVAMTNLYTDRDSEERARSINESLFTAETMRSYAADAEPGLVATILHEATHNLGPAQEYRVNGQDDTALFGGGMASMLEEFKAQSGALFFLELLAQRSLWEPERIQQTYLNCVAWALGHISRGMYTEGGGRKAYSQLAAIQVGFLMDEGVVVWDPNATAANGVDRGAFSVRLDAMPAASRKLMTLAMRIKATGDRTEAERIAARYVDGDLIPMAIVTERHARAPRASFVFSVEQ